jgi:hypothetical protein
MVQRFVPLFYNGPLIMPLSAQCTPSKVVSTLLPQHRVQTKQTMSDQQISEKRTAPETSSSINSLIAAANKNDRFKLLEDDCVHAADLDNPIHPVFSWLDSDGSMKQMLLLASQFLAHESTLVFFVPLLYGRELTKAVSKTTKTCLSDPFSCASSVEREQLIAGVRQALHCLAHTLELRFAKPEKHVYARTSTSAVRPVYTPTCCRAFQRRVTAVIEIADRFTHFYDSDEYKNSSRCAQFRHDFLFASTLVHEIAHAVGVMRRGNLIEPYIRADDPDSEWGYAWEHFMFGCVINPQDRTRLGTHLLMRKIWADSEMAEEAGGKEYSDVSAAYVAQWFRKDTWAIIARQGPTAILPPTTHFKIQSSRKYGGWIVSTDCNDIKDDLVILHQQWKENIRKLTVNGGAVVATHRIFWRPQSTEALQKSNVTMPSRSCWLSCDSQIGDKRHGVSVLKSAIASGKICSTGPANSPSDLRKRKAVIETEGVRTTKRCKRLC